MQSVYYVIRDRLSRFPKESDESLVFVNKQLFFHSLLEARDAFKEAKLPTDRYQVQKFEI